MVVGLVLGSTVVFVVRQRMRVLVVMWGWVACVRSLNRIQRILLHLLLQIPDQNWMIVGGRGWEGEGIGCDLDCDIVVVLVEC